MKRKPHEPRVRKGPPGAGFVVDNLDPYIHEVAGTPPDDFNELVEAARTICARAAEAIGIAPDTELSDKEGARVFSKVRDIMLIAAYAYSFNGKDGLDENPLAFVQRAKMVVDWCKRPLPELTGLKILENKARALAHLIASRLFRGEGFVLLIFNEQPGFITWISSTRRAETIAALRKSLNELEATERVHTQ